MWHGQFIIAPYGRRIGIRATTPELLRAARLRLLPGWVEEEGRQVEFQWSLSEDLATYQDQVFPGDPVRTFDRYFHLYVGETAVDRTFIHAGVAVSQGRAILLPGRTHTGKSTLTQALVARGATFYSDDLAAIDQDGRVFPYPKPLCIRRPGGVEETAAPGWHPALPAVPVALIAGLQFLPETPELSWERLSPGQAVFMLLEHCLGCRREPARDLATIKKLCTRADLYRGQRGEADAAAERLLDMLAGICAPQD